MADRAFAERDLGEVDYRVQVAYSVPVEAIVDLKRGTVDRVVAIDEQVALDPKEGAREESFLRPVPTAVAKRATEIAETAAWPSWEFGF